MGYGAGMTDKETIMGTDEPDCYLPLNEIHVVPEEVLMPDDELTGSPNGKRFYYYTMLLPNCH